MSIRPCILVTRPDPDAAHTAEALEQLGFCAAHLSMLNIRPEESARTNISLIDKKSIQAIALTSHHALSCLEPLRELPLAVVGSASKTKASTLAFEHIYTATGDAASLTELITRTFSPDAGAILYPRGRHVAFDLSGALRSRGFTVKEIIAYEAHPIAQLPTPLLESLERGNIHAVTAYSARTLHTLERLVRQHHLEEAAMHVNLVCLSAKIAKEATHGLWQKVVHADAPEEAAMLEAFKRLYGEPPRITTRA